MKPLAARFRPKLRSILILTHVLVLLLPLAGIAVLRIYDNALIRQTQAELVAQAGIVSALFSEKISDYQSESDPYLGLDCGDTPKYYRDRVPEEIDLFRHQILPALPEPLSATAQAHPVALRAGRVVSNILKKSKSTTLAGTRVLDTQGRIVASSGEEQGLSLAHWPEVQTALLGKATATVRERLPDPSNPNPALTSLSRGSRVRLYVCLPIYGKNRVLGAVLLSRTPLDVRKALYEKRYDILAASLFFLAIVLIISLISAYFVTRPSAALISQAEKLARGEKDWNAIAPKAVTEEVERLSEAFSAMASTLEKRADYIKQFAMHVSHEFKTPLSSLRGSIELLQDHWDSMPKEKRLRFLENIAADTARLDRLVSRLLELAHADVAPGVAVGQENCQPLALLKNLENKYADLGLKLVIAGADQEVKAGLPGEVLETAFSNLFGNSLQHGAKTVAVSLVATPQSIEISLVDDGPGISAANAAQIFTPFFTTQRDSGGTGLGLTITKTLLEANHSQIFLLPSEKGAAFKIKVPTART